MAALLSWISTLRQDYRPFQFENGCDDKEMLVYGETTANLMKACTTKRRKELSFFLEDVEEVLHLVQIVPSRVQVREMLEFAAESRPDDRPSHLTFGELCLFAVDLSAGTYDRYWHYGQKCIAVEQPSVSHRHSTSPVKYQVFLGGSCNPTTWRQDLVIPILEEEGVTFYNPQMESWHPGLMELENEAKEAADVFFFVIDNQTRAIAAMVEAAYLSASGKPIILTLIDYPETTVIDGTPLESREVRDLLRGRIFLSSVMAQYGLPVFNDIEKAARACCKVLKHKVPLTSFGLSDGAQPARMAGASVGRSLIAAREAFRHCAASDHGCISAVDARLALKSLCQVEDSEDDDWDCPLCHIRISEKKDRFSFDEFCCLAAETLSQREKQSWLYKILDSVSCTLAGFFDFLCRRWKRKDAKREYFRDVFLGGSCGNTTWRSDVSIPMLTRLGISFYNPQVENWSFRFLSVEAQAKANCHFLLYMITADSLSVASLVEAASFIGEGRHIVLCLNNIEDGTEVHGVKMVGRAVRDYNRGRSYAAQYANKCHVPVFKSADAATQCVIARLKGRQILQKADSTMELMRGAVPRLLPRSQQDQEK